MEICEKELKDRRIELEREIDQMQQQLQQAQLQLQSLPLRIASRRGEIIGIDRILQQKPKAENVKKQESDK